MAVGQCHLRFANVTVDAEQLERNIALGIVSDHSVMNETRSYKSLALGPARLLNASDISNGAVKRN